MNTSQAFLDTSFFKAFIDPEDEFHMTALSLWQKMQEQQVSLITSNYILDESFTLIRVRCGTTTVSSFRSLLAKSGSILKIIRVTTQDEATAWEWFLKDWSKLSFTDCTCFALMKRLGIHRVASFDDHFKRAGFTLEK